MHLSFIAILLFFPIALLAQKKLPDLPGTIFWKVYPQNDPAKVSYILGTNHAFGGSFVDSLPGLKKKLRDAELFICEALLRPDALTPAYGKPNYKALLSNADYSLVNNYLVRNGFVSLRELDSANFPLYMLLVNVVKDEMARQNQIKQSNDLIMDNYLVELARESKKEMLALDSGFVIKDKTLGYTGKDKWLADRLVSFIKAIENNDTTMNATLRSTDMKQWNINYEFETDARGTVGTMAQELLIERNAYWLPKLTQSLQQKRCFVAVGIGHLMYKKSLLIALMAKGFEVQPVMQTELR
jgi:uncharacterized protein YbaP (TraB family)